MFDGFSEFVLALGFCFILFSVARILHSIAIFLEDNDKPGFLVKTFAFISYFLYFCVLPLTGFIYLIFHYPNSRSNKIAYEDGLKSSKALDDAKVRPSSVAGDCRCTLVPPKSLTGFSGYFCVYSSLSLYGPLTTTPTTKVVTTPSSLWLRNVRYTPAANIQLAITKGVLIINQVLVLLPAEVVRAHLLPVRPAGKDLNFMMNYMTILIIWFGSHHMALTITKRNVSSCLAMTPALSALSMQNPTTIPHAVVVTVNRPPS